MLCRHTILLYLILSYFKFVGPKPEDLKSLEDEVWNCPKGSIISGDEITVPVAAEDLQYQIQITIDGGLKVCNSNDVKII